MTLLRWAIGGERPVLLIVQKAAGKGNGVPAFGTGPRHRGTSLSRVTDQPPPRVSPFGWADPLPDDEVERALVVVAHPDDADFGAAGTIAGWVDRGIAVTLLLCTKGEQGGFDETPRSEMPEIREREQRAASAELGVSDVRFLQGWSDGWLEPTFALQREIVEVIRDVRPRRVLTQSPQRLYQRLQASHPDHLAAGEATVRAVYPAAENRFAWPELIEQGLEPWKVTELWLMAHGDMPHVVDTTDHFDRKVAALRAHVSQTAHLGDGLAEMLRDWNAGNAAVAGLPEGRLAELFAVSRIN
jgi:LmbE family N-acetylglucosaminyl deacetylase